MTDRTCRHCGNWEREPGPNQTSGICRLHDRYTFPDASCPVWAPRESEEGKE